MSFQSKALFFCITIAFAAQIHAKSKFEIEPMLDGHRIRCEEGGDTLGNRIGYKIVGGQLEYTKKTKMVRMSIKTVYGRCELINGKAVYREPVNPFSSYTFRIGSLNDKNEIQWSVITKRFTAFQMLALGFDDGAVLSKSTALVPANWNTKSGKLSFDLDLELPKILNENDKKSLESGNPVDMRIELVSAAQDQGTTYFGAGGGFALSFRLQADAKAGATFTDVHLDSLQ